MPSESVVSVAPDRLDVVALPLEVEDDGAESRGPEVLDGLHAADARVGLKPLKYRLSLSHDVAP